MAETTAQNPAENPSPEEVTSVIAELEQYRQRLVDDFTATAKKAKLPKSMAMAQLKQHPEIMKIDSALAKLQGETPDTDEPVAQTE